MRNLTREPAILKRVHIDVRDLAADRRQLAVIVDDLRRNGGLYTPTVNWVLLLEGRSADEVDDGHTRLDEGFSDQAVSERMSTMEKMLQPWIGCQRQSASSEAVARYAPYLTAHDPLGLWEQNVVDPGVLSGLLEADLGTILDLNIIYSHSALAAGHPAVILEIGGGYGRLAEAALNVFDGSIKYVLADSVPGSLLYARDYLRRACPRPGSASTTTGTRSTWTHSTVTSSRPGTSNRSTTLLTTSA